MAARRVHVGRLEGAGQMTLGPGEGHHLRDVLRIAIGEEVELFDDAGRRAAGRVVMVTPSEVVVEVIGEIDERRPALRWTVAAAVPKGQRADWMIEKLSELGAEAFVPLETERSVVHPEGTNKLDRWRRIALEAAKQSRRAGVMRVEEMVGVGPLVERMKREGRRGWYLSTSAAAQPVARVIGRMGDEELVLLVGPEGGWTKAEEETFEANGLTGVALTASILRVETAAVLAGGILAAWFNGGPTADQPNTG